MTDQPTKMIDLFTFKGAMLEECDLPRLGRRARKIWDLMADGHWHDLNDIARQTGYPHSSVTACVRAFRYPENGGHTVEITRDAPGSGTWLYLLVPASREEVRANKALAEARKSDGANTPFKKGAAWALNTLKQKITTDAVVYPANVMQLIDEILNMQKPQKKGK